MLPGLAGIIGPTSKGKNEEDLLEMLRSMKHEHFYSYIRSNARRPVCGTVSFYRQYADVIIECDGISQEEVCTMIIQELKANKSKRVKED